MRLTIPLLMLALAGAAESPNPQWEEQYDKLQIRHSRRMVTDTSAELLKVPSYAYPPDHPDFDVATAPPVIDFAIVQVTPEYLENGIYGGWGENRLGPDGKYYFSVGNHKGYGGADAFIIAYDPGLQQRNELKVINLHCAKEWCGDGCFWRPARPVRMQERRQRRPPRRPDERIELARFHRRLGLNLRESVRFQEISPMLPLPQDRVFRHTVAVRVLDSNEMKEPAVLGRKRLNGRDDPPPVADCSQHAGSRMLNRLRWNHLIPRYLRSSPESPILRQQMGEWRSSRSPYQAGLEPATLRLTAGPPVCVMSSLRPSPQTPLPSPSRSG